MDRNASLALACALAAHALVASVWPEAPVRESVPPQADEEVVQPEPVPIEVEVVLLPPSALPAEQPERVPRAAKLAVRTSERSEPATRRGERQPTGPASQSPDRAGDAVRSPGAKSPGESLRMRGSSPRVDLDPRAGSGLQAAIDGAASSAPAGTTRNDLLGGSSAPAAERSPWRDSGNGTMRATGEPFKASIAADGTIRFQDRPNVQFDGIGTMPGTFIPALSGRFDVTDAVMASLGEVLYPYRKLKLMDQSREMRAGMAVRAKGQALEVSLAGYPRRLHTLWRDSQYTLAQRKQLLFALWDECAESGDDNVMATARSIRASTLAFIRKVLPAGAPGAYTETELAELNARRQSAAAFEPYL